MTDTTVEAPATPRLKQKYNEQIVPELEKEFHYSNPMQVARVQKVVVSMGVGAAARDSKLIEGAVKDLTDHRPEAEDHQGQEVCRAVPPA